MSPRVLVVYYSATGSVHRLAEAVAAGAGSVGADVRLRRVAELAPAEAIASNPAWAAHREETDAAVAVATLDDLEWADGYAFGTPTRYGAPAAQARMPGRPPRHHRAIYLCSPAAQPVIIRARAVTGPLALRIETRTDSRFCSTRWMPPTEIWLGTMSAISFWCLLSSSSMSFCVSA